MSTKIKMCGLSRPEDITFANEVKPEYIGFVFAEKSKRYITPEKAAELAEKLDISREHLAKLETGKRRISLKLLFMLSEILETSESNLLNFNT